ncbi:MAG: polymer-forming cytoskeletal protein [Simkaniaceae bacterium]|nr:polymer-forming cytoskeletal protein [Simkaniaceae bacterium]
MRYILMSLFFMMILFAEDEINVLSRHAIHQGDYFSAGKTVEISGLVTGDVYASGGQVIIDGEVDGDLLVFGGSVSITGHVKGNVRVASGQLMLSGLVDRNVTLLSGNGEFLPSGHVQGNIFAVAGNLDLGSRVDGHVRVYASNLRLSNEIGKTFDAYVGQLRVTSKGGVGERLEYWSNNEAMISEDAHIGKIEQHPSFFYKLTHGKIFTGLKIGSILATRFMNFLYTFIIGLILMKYFPSKIWNAVNALGARPIQSLIAGVVVAFILPIAAFAMLVTILGAPFALTLIAMNVFFFYTAKIVCIFWAVKHVYEGMRFRRLYFGIGLFLYFALTLIPILGWVISLGALFMGLGSLVLSSNSKQAIV